MLNLFELKVSHSLNTGTSKMDTLFFFYFILRIIMMLINKIHQDHVKYIIQSIKTDQQFLFINKIVKC